MLISDNLILNTLDKPEIGETELQYTHDYKYLGVGMDMNLTFNEYLKNLMRNVSFRLGQFCKIRKYISKQTAVMLYKSMILSLLNYGSVFYSSANVSCLKKLQSMQNKAIRIINISQRVQILINIILL